MKKIYLLTLLLSIVTMAFAQQRSVAECKTIAQHVLNSSAAAAAGDMALLCTSNEVLANTAAAKGAVATEPQFYVYGHSNGAPGFVIVSADEAMQEVLGYSMTGNFDVEAIPDAARELLAVYAQRALNGDMKPVHLAHATKAAVTEVKPLLGDIAFDQFSPYNGKCPLYNNDRCIVGCTAIAMSQIMAYYKYPARMDATKGKISYTTESYKISASWNPATTVFDWNNIISTYTAAAPVFDASATFTNTAEFSFSGFEQATSPRYIVLKNLSNKSTSTFNGTVQLLLTDANNVVKGFAGAEKVIEDLGRNYYYPTFYMTPVMDTSIPDGTYKVYVVTKRTGATNWSVAKSDSSSPNYITVTKHGNTFSMLNQEFACGYNATQADAIATLCGACAHSLKADFGVSATSGSILNMANSLIDYMGYSDRLKYLQPAYFSTDGWHEFLQNEVVAQRPIFVSGYSANSGHAFVIDGFNYVSDVPYYHVNWGWNGGSNGYFLIDYLKPSEAGAGGYETNYAEELYVMTNIRPASASSESCQMAATSITVDETEVNPGDYVTVRVTKFGNRSMREIPSADIYLYAISDDGTEYKIGKWMSIGTLGTGYYYKDMYNYLRMPQNISGGEYTLELRSLDSDCSVATTVISPSSPKIRVKGTSTAVDAIDADATDAAVRYDVSGRKAGAATKGIIISNGTKMIAK